MLVNYRVNEQTFQHPLLAWEAGKLAKVRPTLALGDSFKDYNWHTPVTMSIKELEDIRVAQILNKGKPVRVIYSGGSDSHTIAHAFCRNKHRVFYSLIDFQTLEENLLDGQKSLQEKIDRLNALHDHYQVERPDIEIITVGGKEINAHFTPEFYLQGAFYNCNKSFNLNQIEVNLRRSKLDPSLTTNVYGIEKPRVYLGSKGPYWQITDTMSMYAYSLDYDSTWFYIDEALPDLIKAQVQSVYKAAANNMRGHNLGEALRLLQTTQMYYFRWCKALGRQIDSIWAMRSRNAKTYVSTYEMRNDPRYIHLKTYQEERGKAWDNYTQLFETLKDITGRAEITSILSERFYFTPQQE